MTGFDVANDKFREYLHNLTMTEQNGDEMTVLENFGDCPGTDHTKREGLLCRHWIGECDGNGFLPLKTSTEDDFIFTTTYVCRPNLEQRHECIVTHAPTSCCPMFFFGSVSSVACYERKWRIEQDT
ncbi:hypothetical protein AAHC03_09429 [Spirometra sp. Aus1]